MERVRNPHGSECSTGGLQMHNEKPERLRCRLQSPHDDTEFKLYSSFERSSGKILTTQHGLVEAGCRRSALLKDRTRSENLFDQCFSAVFKDFEFLVQFRFQIFLLQRSEQFNRLHCTCPRAPRRHGRNYRYNIKEQFALPCVVGKCGFPAQHLL